MSEEENTSRSDSPDKSTSTDPHPSEQNQDVDSPSDTQMNSNPSQQRDAADDQTKKTGAKTGDGKPAEETPTKVESEVSTESNPKGDASSEEASESGSDPDAESLSVEEYEFTDLPTRLLPTDVQYTVEYDDRWVYSTGHKAGAGRDDVPVQGLEIAVIMHESRIVDAITSVLNALISYHDETGDYPRHRIIKSKSYFNNISSESWGMIATFQTRPDDHDGLLDHLSEFRTEDCSLETPANIDSTMVLLQHLAKEFENATLLHPKAGIDVPSPWDEAVQVGKTVLFERYTALGSDYLYNPRLDGEDLDQKIVESPSNLSSTPELCSIDRTDELEFIQR